MILSSPHFLAYLSAASAMMVLRSKPCLNPSISQIKYVKNKGGIDLIGLGPDWILGDTERDEKYMHNTEQETITWTKCLEDSSRIKNLIPQLQLAGFSEQEIDRILYLNMQRLFKAVLPS